MARHHRLRCPRLVGAPLLTLSLIFWAASFCMLWVAVPSHPLSAQTGDPSFESRDPESSDPEHRLDPSLDLRSTEWLRYNCSNALGRRDITLFANGTVRLREGLWESQTIFLHELGPEKLRREQEILSDALKDDATSRLEIPLGGVEGQWVERCEVDLQLPDSEPFLYRFGQFEMPPLQVARLVQIAEDLAALTRPLDPIHRLSPDYEPQLGDTLIDGDGKRFVVMGLTADGGGVEVESESEPMRIFHPIELLPNLFVAFEPRNRR